MMKTAFLFPGQGSQSVGMLGQLADDVRFQGLLKSMSAQAQEVLGEDLFGLIQNGPAEQLNLTTHTQPAMLFADVAVYEAWLLVGGAKPAMVAGHSLGEYAALVAAGVLTFEDALGLVRVRAQAMQLAVPVGQGAMAAVLGLSDDDVRKACQMAVDQGETAEAVNYNAPSQVVIAGSTRGVQLACEQAKALGAKRALELPVSAPFHSSLMKPAAEVLAVALEKVDFKVPSIPVVNNIDVQTEADPAAIRAALVRQAYGPVRWVETISHLDSCGIERYIECGPGKVLAGLVKRISSNPVLHIGDPSSIDAVFSQSHG